MDLFRFAHLTLTLMNIGITVYPSYGGSGIVGSELGRELAAARSQRPFYLVESADASDRTERRVQFHEVEMMSYPLFEHQPYDLALATKMATVARSEKLDLLHVHYAIPHSIRAILARESIKDKRYVPVITTLHGTDITLVGADRSYLPITKYGLQQSDGVTAVSRFLKQATIETFDFDEIEVIPNFICPNHYQRIADSPLDAKNLRRTAKNCSFTFPIFAPSNVRPIASKFSRKFCRKAAKRKLVMVGDGPELSAVTHRAEQLDVNERVRFRRQTGEYCGLSRHRGYFASAVGTGIFRSCRARSAGMRSSRYRHAHRRNSRSRDRRRKRIFERYRRHRKNERRRHETFKR